MSALWWIAYGAANLALFLGSGLIGWQLRGLRPGEAAGLIVLSILAALIVGVTFAVVAVLW